MKTSQKVPALSTVCNIGFLWRHIIGGWTKRNLLLIAAGSVCLDSAPSSYCYYYFCCVKTPVPLVLMTFVYQIGLEAAPESGACCTMGKQHTFTTPQGKRPLSVSRVAPISRMAKQRLTPSVCCFRWVVSHCVALCCVMLRCVALQTCLRKHAWYNIPHVVGSDTLSALPTYRTDVFALLFFSLSNISYLYAVQNKPNDSFEFIKRCADVVVRYPGVYYFRSVFAVLVLASSLAGCSAYPCAGFQNMKSIAPYYLKQVLLLTLILGRLRSWSLRLCCHGCMNLVQFDWVFLAVRKLHLLSSRQILTCKLSPSIVL